jgi:hypothetical protein
MTIRRIFLLVPFIITLIAGIPTASAQYSSDTAKIISPNDSLTMAVGTDHDQYWWKIDTPSDGKLVFHVRWTTQPVMDFFVYDRNLSQVGRSTTAGSAASLTLNFLGQETYYIRIARKSGAGNCTFINYFTPASGANDLEPNDTYDKALMLTPGQNQPGHAGYFFAGTYDQSDWWTFTLPGERVFTVSAPCDSTLAIDIILLDKNRNEITRINQDASKPPLIQPLTGGKYYIHIQVRGGEGSYTIMTSLETEPLPGEVEPNDLMHNAIPITVETTVSGHLGYFGENGKDATDFFVFPLTALWDSLYIRSENSQSLDILVDLMYAGGVVTSAHISGTTGYLVCPKAGSSIGTVSYYVRVSCDRGYGSYSFIVSRFSSTPVKSPIAPPTEFTVSDIPGDNGHRLSLSWKLSPDDVYISHYNIFRSRSSTLTPARDLASFTSLDALIAAEKDSTILIAKVPKGQSSYIDPFVPLNGTTYYYWIQSAAAMGGVSKIVASATSTAVEEARIVPFTVYPPFPNPFNPSTVFRYQIPEAGPVSLVVYDILGKKVATLQNSIMSAGVHEIIWNGTDARGTTVSSGTYFYQVRTNGQVQGGKVLFLR